MRLVLVVGLVLAALPACGTDTLDWSGFALLRGAAGSNALPLDDDDVSAQVQLGIDWRPSPTLGAHVHLLARNDEDGGRRGRAGIVEAYLQQAFERGEHRLRLLEGAFFLPGSRENVDALWESPYAITSSALNAWLGEELRPIGIDATYTLRRRWSAAVTLFRGNDTLGSTPADRGWKLHDRWTLLGEHVRVDDEYFTSVSAETDGRLGWAARGRWNNDRTVLQLTHIDNRADALEHGELLNWNTRFDIAAADFTSGDWTVAAEYGWGKTIVIHEGESFSNDLRAGYVLVSRRLGPGRASLRAEEFYTQSVQEGHAFTAAYLWTARPKLRAGAEIIATGEDLRAQLELRYSFP
ncbi:MAG TPA: hypothetical protein VE974_14870 [Thermoanaerobaculia bacterium]|nr:hypothetical protein [Thermoanaerobaculia bacterium]